MRSVSTRGTLVQFVSMESERKASVSSEPTWSTSRVKEKLSQTTVVGLAGTRSPGHGDLPSSCSVFFCPEEEDPPSHDA